MQEDRDGEAGAGDEQRDRGATREARRAIMTASVATRLSHFANVSCYARAATERGEQAMEEMGFRKLPGIVPTVFTLDSET